MENKDHKNNLIRVAGLWARKSKAGDSYMTGRWGGVYVTIFKNKYKQTEADPDFTLHLSPTQGKRKPDEINQEYQPLGPLDEGDTNDA